jgi:hypothetical protein
MYDMGDYGIDPYAAQYMPAAEPSYVPGFTNYLETYVPPYAAPAEAAAQYVEPAQSMPTAQPMTQEAAPFDLSSLAGLDLSGLNFGSDFGGGAMGGLYQADPNLQYIAAPTSNKGNATGKSAGNTFTITPDQPVRLVDLNTKTVIFEGTGADAARKATELGQNLTDTMGRKASYDIQTANPSGTYVTVANEKKNKSTLGTIANIAGTALPIAVSLIPGLQFLGPIASAALAGGAGAALKGDNILKGVAMGGLSAAGGQVLGPALGAGGALGANLAPKLATAIGTGLGSTAGGLATGQSLKSSLLGGVASGALSYVAPTIQDKLGISTKSGSIFRGGNTSASTGGDTGGDFGGANAEIVVNAPAFSTPNIKLGGFKTPAQNYLRDAALDDVINPETRTPYNTGYDGNLINVTGSVPGAVTGGLNLAGLTGNPAANNTDEILVTGNRAGAVTGGVNSLIQPTAELGDPDLIKVTGRRTTSAGNPVVNGVDTVTGEIVTTGNKIEPATGGLTLSSDLLTDVNQMSEAEREAAKKKKLALEDYLRIAGLASGLIGGGGGSGSSGTYGGSGTGRLNPIFSAKLPSAGGLGSIGMNRTQRPMGDVDWLTYGTRPELSFFDYAPRTASPAPVTTPVPGNPAGPIMYDEPVPRFARGGRSEFAVNGAGTGRSDDIPAVLSDGEYVIDAETVALLGDGSSKAGAKKLDELRVKVRKHKGKKLAKGRFSANAKKPEAYLSGGRI